MSKLKPIGSEKLQGDEKLKRIMEIARYKEVSPNSINETTKTDYSITLVDGYTYEIAKEKIGYVIKKRLDEGVSEYVEPMKNRKHYSSYSAAFKRLNLMAGEVNRLHESSEGISLFGEQKKFVLKTPTPAPEETDAPTEDEVTPPAPEAPSEPMDTEVPDMASDEELPLPPAEDGMDTEEMDMPEMGDEDMGEEPADAEEVSFKSIQKLTGKLAQKLRDFSSDNEMSSKDAKYVINSILSALNLNELDEEDKEEIISRFDEVESNYDDMEMSGSDENSEEDFNLDIEVDTEEQSSEDEMKESDYVGSVIDSIFSESKVDSLLQKYFSVNENEKKFIVEKKEEKKKVLKEKVRDSKKEIVRLSESTRQTETALEIIKNFPGVNFVGKTNKGNLVFENKNKQLKVNRSGNIL
jgi:hypothetical protein